MSLQYWHAVCLHKHSCYIASNRGKENALVYESSHYPEGLHRIANRHAQASIQELNATLDRATQMLWNKQHQYHAISPISATSSFGCNRIKQWKI